MPHDEEIHYEDLTISLPESKFAKLNMLSSNFSGDEDDNLCFLASFLLAVALNNDGMIQQAMDLLEEELG